MAAPNFSLPVTLTCGGIEAEIGTISVPMNVTTGEAERGADGRLVLPVAMEADMSAFRANLAALLRETADHLESDPATETQAASRVQPLPTGDLGVLVDDQYEVTITPNDGRKPRTDLIIWSLALDDVQVIRGIHANWTTRDLPAGFTALATVRVSPFQQNIDRCHIWQL